MRIVEAVNSLQLGGIERLVSALAPELANVHGCPTAVVCLGAKTGPLIKQLSEQNIPIFEAARSSKGIWRWIQRLEHVLVTWQPDVYHTHFSFGLPWQVLAACRAGVPRIVVTEQNAYRLNGLARFRNILYDRFYWRYVHAYTCVSDAVRQHLARLRLRSPEDFEVVYNCTDVRRFRPDPARRAIVRRMWGVSPNVFIVGSVGSLTQQKGFDYLVEAAGLICSRGMEIQFRIFGEGPNRQELQQQIEQLGLGHRVFLEGAVTSVEKVLPGFDLFVLPSLWEGMSLAIAEAMATRLPIVATAVAGTTELLAEDAGFLVPPAEIDLLAEAILKLRNDSEERERIAARAYQRVHELFSIQRCALNYLQVFQRESVS